MAALINLVLTKQISPENLVKWLQKNCDEAFVLAKLDEFAFLRSSFIPYFLNMMRESTLHLLENGLSASQSPAKTSSTKKVKAKRPEPHLIRSKRRDLFASEVRVNEDKDKWNEWCELSDSVRSNSVSLSPAEKASVQITNILGERDQNSNKSDIHLSLDESQNVSSSDSKCARLNNKLNNYIASPKETLLDLSNEKSKSSETDLSGSTMTWSVRRKNRKCVKNGFLLRPEQNLTSHAQSTSKQNNISRHKQKFSLAEFLCLPDTSLQQNDKHVSDTYSEMPSREHNNSCDKMRNSRRNKNLRNRTRKARLDTSSPSIPLLSSFQEFPPVNCSSQSSEHLKYSTWRNSGTEFESVAFTSKDPIRNHEISQEIMDSNSLRNNTPIQHSYQNQVENSIIDPSKTSLWPETLGSLRICKRDITPIDSSLKSLDNSAHIDSERTLFAPVKLRQVNSIIEHKSSDTQPQRIHTAVHKDKGSRDQPRRICPMPVKGQTIPNPVFGVAPIIDKVHQPVPGNYQGNNNKLKCLEMQGMVGDTFQSDLTSNPVKSLFPWNKPCDGSQLQDKSCRIHLPNEGGDNIVKLPVKGSKMLSHFSAEELPATDVELFTSVGKMNQKKSSRVCELSSPSAQYKTTQIESININLMQASRQAVTYQESLDLFVQLYSSCLDAHVFPNLTMELYFLTQLLTIQGSKQLDNVTVNYDKEEINYFHSVHNAVYFAVGVMERQIDLLSHLDRSTLRLLSDNERVAEFAPNFQLQLKTAFELSPDKNNLSMSLSPVAGVSFQADTDNRKNFPNDRTFHQFKRQRDMFYELLREWEAKHEDAGWNLESQLGEKIRTLVSARTDLANYLHLARLFVTQLVLMCKGDQDFQTKEDYENILFLAELKQANPEKFLKLQERFILPFSCGGPCPPVIFKGHQQFFHDFIVAAANPVFNQHLSNLLAAQIAELNKSQFGNSNSISDKLQHNEIIPEDYEAECDAFASTLLTLRLLARFFGFLTFLPYQSLDTLPQPLLQDYIAIRNSMTLPLDLIQYTKDAIHLGHLTLTVPWIVEFLALMDIEASQVQPFRNLLVVLKQILILSWRLLKSEFTYGRLLVVTTLGWLFDQPCLPEGHFFSEVMSRDGTDLCVLSSLFPDNAKHVDMVTQDLFYACCPYVGEIRYLLTEFSVGTRRKTTLRKISLTSIEHMSLLPVRENKKNIQMLLEENFFYLHPSSLKRTVDFVAERTASNFIKQLRVVIFPSSLSICQSKARDLMEKFAGLPENKLKDRLQKELSDLAQSICSSQRQVILQDQSQFCQLRIGESLRMLLPYDQAEAVITTATAIAIRLANKKIQQWINSNVTVAIYVKELSEEFDHLKLEQENCVPEDLIRASRDAEKEKYTSLTAQIAISSRGVCKPMYDLLRDAQDLLNCLLIRAQPVVADSVQTFLDNILISLETRQDHPPQIMSCLASMTVDLAVAINSDYEPDTELGSSDIDAFLWRKVCSFLVCEFLTASAKVCRQPKTWSSELASCFIRLWSGALQDQLELSSLCSTLVLDQLFHSSDNQCTVKNYQEFLIDVVNEGLADESDLTGLFNGFLPVNEIYSNLIKELMCALQKKY